MQMTTITSSPSISPKSFVVPPIRGHRGAASSSPGGGTSPFARPRPSPPLLARNRDVLTVSRASVPSTSISNTGSTVQSGSIAGQGPLEQNITSAPRQSSLPPSTPSFPARESASTRDFGTQYTPPGFPPTSTTQTVLVEPPEPRLEKLSSGGRKENSNSDMDSSSGDVFMTGATSEEDTSARNNQAPSTPPTGTGLSISHHPGEQPLRHHAPSNTLAGPSDTGKAVKRNESGVSTTSESSSSLLNTVPSPTKKNKLNSKDLKVMPKDYMSCDVKDLGIVIADMLMELIRLNDRLPPKEGFLTRFHSRYAEFCLPDMYRANFSL